MNDSQANENSNRFYKMIPMAFILVWMIGFTIDHFLLHRSEPRANLGLAQTLKDDLTTKNVDLIIRSASLVTHSVDLILETRELMEERMRALEEKVNQHCGP